MSVIHNCIHGYKSKTGKALYKPYHYADIYAALLGLYAGRNLCLVELGIGYGGCLEMWREFFGAESKIVGIDLNSKPYDDPGIQFIHGDQSKREFLKTIPDLIPKIDIFIDDGSHVNSHQIATMEEVFAHVSPGGLYIVEDVHTSYRSGEYQGGYRHPESFIEYCKNIIDTLHHTEDDRIIKENPVREIFVHQIDYIAFYPTMVVIKKVGTLQ